MSSSEDEIKDITPQNAEDPNEGLPALFWDTIPDNAEDHPDYIALKALDDETTPEERAENFKVGLNIQALYVEGLHCYICRAALSHISMGGWQQRAGTFFGLEKAAEHHECAQPDQK